MEPVEEIARRLCVERGYDPDQRIQGVGGNMQPGRGPIWRYFIDNAEQEIAREHNSD